jgi:ankyrin repeat protein
MTRLLSVGALLAAIGVPLWAQTSPPTSLEQQLMEAAYLGKLEIVKQLVLKGAQVDAEDPEARTSLMWAAFNGHTEVVDYLILRDAEVDSKDSSGRTALMYASSGPYVETVALLLEKGAEVNVQGTLEGFTALMTAAAEGQVEVVRLLLDHGADPSLKDKDGDTAKSFAQENGHSVVVELLESPSP